jgi:hypothetical protein
MRVVFQFVSSSHWFCPVLLSPLEEKRRKLINSIEIGQGNSHLVSTLYQGFRQRMSLKHHVLFSGLDMHRFYYYSGFIMNRFDYFSGFRMRGFDYFSGFIMHGLDYFSGIGYISKHEKRNYK